MDVQTPKSNKTRKLNQRASYHNEFKPHLKPRFRSPHPQPTSIPFDCHYLFQHDGELVKVQEVKPGRLFNVVLDGDTVQWTEHSWRGVLDRLDALFGL